MTKEQKEGLAQLMRAHFKLEADDILLKTILDTERLNSKVSDDWREQFTRLQQCEPYRLMIQEGEAYIAEVLASINRSETMSAFLKSPPKGPVN